MMYLRSCSSVCLILLLVSCSTGVVKPKSNKGSPVEQQTSNGDIPVQVSELSRKQYQYALDLLERKRYQEAEQQLKAIINDYPNLYTPYASLARLYSELERFDEAVKMLRLAIRNNPNDSQLYNQLGIAQRQQGAFRNAAIAYLEAIRLDKNNALAELNLAILYDLYLHDLDNAETHYKRYRELMPEKAKQVDAWLLDLSRRQRR